MQLTKRSVHLAFLALAIWLLGNWAGAHGHFCFDGQEPPVAMHMDVMGDHLEHHSDEIHQDADLAPTKTLIAKLNQVDLGILLLTVVTLLVNARRERFVTGSYRLLLPRKLPHTWPPLRAPPATA
jgi:hypothetical protein